MKNLGLPELLSPAGNLQSLKCAISNGADAVYLGLDEFNARGNIENFTRENLEEVVKYAHLFGVKVYLTLNTLVKDDEIESVLDIVRFALSCKVDAFIVQDIGLAYLLYKKFKNIELHGSTQMGIENLEGVRAIEKLGFTRVVLARETPLSEIKRIRENSNIEIEYFVQGALCVGYSGNCYLCSLLKGASGNRGKCKQLCRLKYKLDNNREAYYLSTKDFCMLPMLKELSQAGVTSFKIEGRARRAAYVAVATNCYRNAIDNNFKYNEEDILKLKKVFNRGDFITGYFKDDKKMFSSVQNHIGVEIGEILTFKKGRKFNEIILKSSHKLKGGDTIKIFENDSEVGTLSPSDIKVLGKDKYLFTTTSAAKAGQKVRLIVDSNLEEKYCNLNKRIKVNAFFVGFAGEKAKLIMKAGDISIEVESENILMEAQNQPLTREDCFISFSKLGEEFELESIDCKLGKVFIRKSELNELRRQAISILREKLIHANEKSKEVLESEFKLNSTEILQKNNKKIVFFDNLEKLKNIQADYFVYSPKIYDKQDIIKIATKKEIYLDMPLIVTGQDIELLRDIFKQCPNLGVYATNYYALLFAKPEKTIIGSEMNVFNSFSLEFYKNQGYKKIVLSKEDFDQTILKGNNIEAFIDKRPPRLIYFKHCPFKEHYNGDCGNCKYRENIKYSLGKDNFILVRKKVLSCHFYLKGEMQNNRDISFGRVIEI